MKILFTGGGTGGHVYPLVATIRELKRLHPEKNLKLFYAGPKDDFGLVLLMQEDVMIKHIISGKIRRYFDLRNILDIFIKIPVGIVQSFFLLLFMRPSLVFSKGGSGSISVTLAARLLGIPVFIHESDVVPGLSNQKTSAWAKKIFTSFPKTEYFSPRQVIVTGNPIRTEVLEGDREHAKKLFNVTFLKPVVLIIGGSQGAEAINDFVLLALNELLKKYEIIHVTGARNFKATEAESQVIVEKDLSAYYHPIAFLNEEQTRHAYASSDIIISRSGSGSIFEIAATGKPSILIPLPSAAADHQSKNAYAYAQTGASVVLEQENLTQNFFMENLEIIVFHPEKIREMKQAALSFAKPLAAKAVAREILEYLMLG